jgi:hypothetical protein
MGGYVRPVSGQRVPAATDTHKTRGNDREISGTAIHRNIWDMHSVQETARARGTVVG